MKTLAKNSVLCFALLMTAGISAQQFPIRTFGDDKGLTGKFIFSISQDTNGVILLATEKGLSTFNGYRFSDVSTKSAAENQASAVYGDSHGQTWVGHFQNGIECVNHEQSLIVDSSGKLDGRINSFTEDSAGNIWGVCDGRGIFRIAGKSRTLSYPEGSSETSGQIIISNNLILNATDHGVQVYAIEGNRLSRKMILQETQGQNVTSLTQGLINGRQFIFAGIPGQGVLSYEHTKNGLQFYASYGKDLSCDILEISALTFDHTNSLWVGLMGEGVRRIVFNPNGLPAHIDVCTMQDGLTDGNIRSLFTDDENNVWAGTFGNGLIEFPFSIFQYYNQSNGLLRREVNCIAEDRMGILWLGTDCGVTRFCISESRAGQSVSCASAFGKKEGFDDVAVSCMVSDTAGLIWIGTATNGIYRLDPVKLQFENLSEKYNLQSRMINTLTLTKDGNVIAGTTDGAYVFTNGGQEVKSLTTMEGLLHNDVHNLYTDHANSVWFSSEGTPPYAMHDEQFYVFHKIDQLRGFMITGVSEDYTGTRWITTSGDGVFAFDGVNFHQYTERDGLKSDNCIASVAEDNGILWVVHNSGLSMKYPDDKLFHYFSSTDNTYLNSFNPQVYKARNGTIYFCSDNGLVELPVRETEMLRRYPKVSLASVAVNGVKNSATDHLDLPAGTYNLSFEYNSILLNSSGPNPFYYRISGADSAWRQSTDRNIEIPKLGAGDYVLQVTGEPPFNLKPGLIREFRIHVEYPFWEQSWFIITMLMSGPLILLVSIRFRTLQLTRINKRLHVLVQEKTHMLQSEKESVAKMNVELKAKTKDITDSIRYAMRIQMAILPDMNVLRKVFPDSFVFYRPRDIVSGDFYWFAEKDNQLIIAVVDCTGHGVPGALMSMIGTTLINKVVFDFRVDSPSGILEFLNREIKTALHQNDSLDSSHDGMDIAVCVYDRLGKTLRYAGAGRPLVRIKDGEPFLYKTNQGGLGGVYTNRIQLFSEIDFHVQSGEQFYMFTDGFPDQFGSDEHKKYSTAHFKSLLHELSAVSMDKQHTLLAAEFENWKGSAEQFDDVLVVGFRIP